MGKIFFLFLLAWTAPAAALELSLEENRGESGTIGYVDIDRVFKEYSATANAREEFLGEIKKKEESLNLRKHEIHALKADIAKLRQEREFALTLPSLLATQEQLNFEKKRAVEELRPQAETAPAPEASISTAPPAAAPQASTSTAAPAAAAPAIPISSLPGLGINMPGVAAVPVNNFKFSVSTSVPDIDAALGSKEAALKQKEDELKLYQRQIEKELLEYESHRSEIILGRIYLALKELAVKEEVSVIVDKRNILFGHSAVDLTEKLLSKLEESQ
jgi:Skp family chaperone for outer membrane proteins